MATTSAATAARAASSVVGSGGVTTTVAVVPSAANETDEVSVLAAIGGSSLPSVGRVAETTLRGTQKSSAGGHQGMIPYRSATSIHSPP